MLLHVHVAARVEVDFRFIEFYCNLIGTLNAWSMLNQLRTSHTQTLIINGAEDERRTTASDHCYAIYRMQKGGECVRRRVQLVDYILLK